MTCLELHHNSGQYALAIELGQYRSAARICIVAIRRIGADKQAASDWLGRLRYCMAKRHVKLDDESDPAYD